MSEATGVLDSPRIEERSPEKSIPQELRAMQTFATAIQNQKNTGEGEVLSRGQIEELFRLDDLRQNQITNQQDGWKREIVAGPTFKVHIKPEDGPGEGDMMLNYTDMRGNHGENAHQESLAIDTTFPDQQFRQIEIYLMPNNEYKFKVELDSDASDKRQVITGLSQEITTGETTETKWIFD